MKGRRVGPLYFHDDGDDDGAALRSVVDRLGQPLPDVLLDGRDVADPLGRAPVEDVRDPLPELVEDCGRTRGGKRRRAMTRSGPAMTRASSASTVTTTIMIPSAERCFRSRRTASPTSPTPEPSTITLPPYVLPIFSAPAAVNSTTSPFSMTRKFYGSIPGPLREPGVRDEHPVFAVHRNEMIGAHQVEHQQQFLLRGMTRDVRRPPRVP